MMTFSTGFLQKNVFVGSITFICDFHREQAWLRWVTASKHGVVSCKEDVLKELRKVAAASTPDEVSTAIAELETSSVWTSNDMLSSWFKRKWLPHSKVSRNVQNVEISPVCLQNLILAFRIYFGFLQYCTIDF
jgi:hypothetical protein